MALALKDRVKETTIVVGTGAATLLGSSIGFQPFSVVGNGNTTYYCISDQFGSNWEVGIGTYSSSGNTLARTTVLASSNGGALVVFTAGVKDVFVTYPAEKGVWYDASGNVLFTGTTTATNLAYTGTLTGSTGILNIGSGQLYKDASGKVGINVTPAAGTNAKLQVTGGATNATTLATSYSNAVVAYVPKSSSGYSLAIASGTNDCPQLQVSANGATSGDLLIQPYGGNVGIGTTDTSLFNAAGGSTRLAVCGSSASTDILGNNGPSISIINTDTTANNTAGLHFARADTDDTPNYAGASIVAQFPDTQVASQYPKGLLAFLTSTNANTAPSEKMRIDASGNVGIGTSNPKVNLSLNGAVVSTGTANILRLYDDGAVSTSTTSNSCGFGFSSATGQISYTSGSSGLHAFYTSNTPRMTIDASGNLLVGVTASIGGLNAVGHFKNVNAGAAGIVVGNAGGTSTTNTILFTNSNGTVGGISTSGSATAFNTSSDYRLKNTITPMTGALDKVALLKPVTYKWNVDGSDGQGFIAHELQAVVPDCVSGEKDAVNEDGSIKAQGIDPSKLVATLTAAIQEQQTLIEALTARLTALEAK